MITATPRTFRFRPSRAIRVLGWLEIVSGAALLVSYLLPWSHLEEPGVSTDPPGRFSLPRSAGPLTWSRTCIWARRCSRRLRSPR
jgi:hypothetical protein